MEVLVHGSIKINGTAVAVVLAQLLENCKALLSYGSKKASARVVVFALLRGLG